MEVVKMDVISVSQLNLYRSCSLKYKFQYIDRLPKPFKSSALAFGATMHSAIEWLHKKRMSGKEVTLEGLHKTFSVDWYSQTVDTEIRYKEGEKEDELVAKAKALLTLYHGQGPRDVTGTEVSFKVPLADLTTGEVLDLPLLGYMDLVEHEETITEVKTTASALDIESLDTQFQLLAYDYGFQMKYRREPKRIKIINLVKTKKPKIEVREIERPYRDHRWFFHTAKEAIRGIRQGVFFPNPSFRCKECEYSGPCQNWQGNK